MGVNPVTPVPFVCRPFDPTPTDYANFILGTVWLNTTTEAIWWLVRKANFVSTWMQIAASSGELSTLTGNNNIPVAPLAGNINIVGDGTTINVVGDAATHTLTISALGTGITETLTGDTGVAIDPIAGNINVITGLSTLNAGASVSLDGDNSNATLTFNVTDIRSNTFIGKGSGNTPLIGTDNVGLGALTLAAISTGVSNTALGTAAGINLTIGSDNILIGFNSGDNLTSDEHDNIVIGNDGVSSVNDAIYIGTVGTQTTNFQAGIYGVEPTETNEIVSVNSATGQLGSFTFTDINGDVALPQDGTILFTSSNSSVTITASDNTLNFEAVGGGSGTVSGLQGDNAVVALPNGSGVIIVAGGSGISTSGNAGDNTLTISATGTVFFNYTNVTTSPYVVLSTDQYISVNTASIAITIQLPNTPVVGQAFVIKDRSGNAAVNNITVTTVSGTTLIDGATTLVENTAYESINVIGNGTTYEVF